MYSHLIERICAHEQKEMEIYANKNKNKAFQMNFLNANHHNIPNTEIYFLK